MGAPRPVRSLWERLPAHMSSLMAWASREFLWARAPQVITVRSSPSAISSVSRLPVTEVKYRSRVCIIMSTTPQETW